MAALDFPSSPTVGQIYSANSKTWQWDGASWKNVIGPVGAPSTKESIVRTSDGVQFWWNGTAWVYLPPDPYWASVAVLMPLNTSTGSSFDQLGYCTRPAITVPPTPTGIAVGAALFGRAFAWRGASASYIYLPNMAGWEFGTGPYTQEAWIYTTTYGSSSAYVLSNRPNNDSTTFLELAVNTAGALQFGNQSHSLVGGTVPLNAWTHISGSRDGTNMYAHVNGVQAGAPVADAVAPPTGQIFTIGITGFNIGSGSFFFPGWIAHVRITKGVCRYTANFTPPATPFASY